MTEPWWISLIKSLVIVNLVMLSFAYTTWLERKLLGRMQLRYGPNRAGPKGLLVPIADLLKLIRKEAFAPAGARQPLYILAPIISMATALAAFSVLPWGAGWTVWGYYIGGTVVKNLAWLAPGRSLERVAVSQESGVRSQESGVRSDIWLLIPEP